MDLNAFFVSQLDAHRAVVSATREALGDSFAGLVTVSAEAVRNRKKIVFFGNGGSAADAQHLATELTVRYSRDRDPIAAIALTTDTSALTAIGNDFGFEDLFARQVQALCVSGDVAIGISTSGNSENVVRGLEMARKVGAVAAGLAGRDGGRMRGLADPLLVVPSDDTARIQETHITLGHVLCAALERELGLT